MQRGAGLDVRGPLCVSHAWSVGLDDTIGTEWLCEREATRQEKPHA